MLPFQGSPEMGWELALASALTSLKRPLLGLRLDPLSTTGLAGLLLLSQGSQVPAGIFTFWWPETVPRLLQLCPGFRAQSPHVDRKWDPVLHAHHPRPSPVPGPCGAGDCRAGACSVLGAMGLGFDIHTQGLSSILHLSGAGLGRSLVSTGSPCWEGRHTSPDAPRETSQRLAPYLAPQPYPTPDQPGTAQAPCHLPRRHLWAILEWTWGRPRQLAVIPIKILFQRLQ